jgi:hypothetical protein
MENVMDVHHFMLHLKVEKPTQVNPKSHLNIAFQFLTIVCFIKVLWSLWMLYYNLCAYKFVQNNGDH